MATRAQPFPAVRARRMAHLFAPAALLLSLGANTPLACASGPLPPGATPSRVVRTDAYRTPLPGLTTSQRARFDAGHEVFTQRWSVAPSAFGQWGRGPTSNAEACADCHRHHGRGAVPSSPREPVQSIVVRLSVQTPEGAVSPHPAYGSQLQTQGVLGKVPPEGRAYLRWTHTTFRYPDGRNVALRSPRVVFGELAHGPLGDGALASARLAPAIASIGLLESIPAAALIEHEAAGRTRGRLHRIVDHDTDETAIGRFGWKATQPTLPEQVTLAFLEDLGVTSGRHPADNCPELQRACLESPTAPYPELDADRLDALIAHLRSIAPPPARSDRAGRGARMFAATGCGKCHVPTWPVDPHPDRPDITQVHPYTDMMLHDMGPALSDGRPDGIATGAEWRTAPLWGIGRSRTANGNAFFLHDGRARSIEEAILWHSGEGAGARRRFVRLRRPDREALLRFIDGL